MFSVLRVVFEKNVVRYEALTKIRDLRAPLRYQLLNPDWESKFRVPGLIHKVRNLSAILLFLCYFYLFNFFYDKDKKLAREVVGIGQ